MTDEVGELARPSIDPDAAPEGEFGSALRAAREAAGLSVASLAGRLRLHPRQVEALERGDLKSLPALIYVRGFVRGCARELKIDAAPLLADLERRAGVTPDADLPAAGAAFPLARFGDGSRAIMALVLAILLVAGIVGALIPRHRAGAGAHAEAPAELAAPVPVLPEPSEAPHANDGARGSAADGAAGEAERRNPALPADGRLPAPKADPAPVRRAPPAAEAAPAPAPVAESAPVAAIEAAAPAGAPVPPPAPPDLVLNVREISWVEVVGSNGATLLAEICRAGSVHEVRGKAPFRIVIGNAAAVDAQFRGVAVDVSRYANVNGVARFTLE